jgi:chromosome partitioning protein
MMLLLIGKVFIIYSFKMQAKIITITQQKGGCGKTTITAHLAVALGLKNYKIAIIDIDPQASLTKWYNLREANHENFQIPISFISTTGWRLQNCINEIRNHYDFIIIDSPPHTEIDAKSAIRVSTLVLIPLQPSPTDLWAINNTIEICQREEKPFKIVLNRMTSNNKFLKEVLVQLPYNLSSLGNRIAFSSCLLKGSTALESEPKSLAAQEVNNLAQEVEEILLSTKVKEEA